jgi:hypothetical protein
MSTPSLTRMDVQWVITADNATTDTMWTTNVRVMFMFMSGQCHYWQGWMWTTSHVNATTDKDGCGQHHMLMPPLTRMDVDNSTSYFNATTDKDGCGQQHMLF